MLCDYSNFLFTGITGKIKGTIRDPLEGKFKPKNNSQTKFSQNFGAYIKASACVDFEFWILWSFLRKTADWLIVQNIEKKLLDNV